MNATLTDVGVTIARNLVETLDASHDILAFRRPPVVEVALAIQFSPETLNEPVVFAFRETVKDRYPVMEKYPPRPAMLEEFVLRPMPQVQFEMIAAPPMPLYWFTTEDSTMLIQLQSDRVAFNWRRRTAEDEYPLYEKLRDEFDPMVRTIREMIVSEGREFSCNWCEVTYINHIVPKAAAHDVSRLLSDFQAPSLPGVEDLGLLTRYRIEDAAGEPRGRMSVSLNSATLIEENEPIWALTLTTRLLAHEATLEAALDALDEGRAYAGRGFGELTTDEMQALWERVS